MDCLDRALRCCDERDSSGHASPIFLPEKVHNPGLSLHVSITAQKHHKSMAKLTVGSEKKIQRKVEIENPTEAEAVETSTSQEPVSSTEAEGGCQAATSSSFIRSLNGSLSSRG